MCLYVVIVHLKNAHDLFVSDFLGSLQVLGFPA